MVRDPWSPSLPQAGPRMEEKGNEGMESEWGWVERRGLAEYTERWLWEGSMWGSRVGERKTERSGNRDTKKEKLAGGILAERVRLGEGR